MTAGRRLLLGLGLAVLAAAWAGPLPALAQGSFLAHMTMHVAVVAVAAPLIAAGLAGTAHDPAARWPALFAPVPAAVLELLVVWGWHAPGPHDLARGGGAWLALEQGLFLVVALLVWLSALGGGGGDTGSRRRERAAAGIGGLMLTSMHMTLLGALLALGPRSLYASHAAAGPAGAVHDQQAGGIVMLAVGGLSYLIGGLALLAGLLRDDTRREDAT